MDNLNFDEDSLDSIDIDKIDNSESIELDKSDITDKIDDSESVDLGKSDDLDLVDHKILLNVGGKKYSIKIDILDFLNIDYKKLFCINKIKKIYFLDYDYVYFSQIIKILIVAFQKSSKKTEPFDQKNMIKEYILSYISDFSDQFIAELCYYNLIEQKYKSSPKIKLIQKNIVSDDSKYIVKIIISDHVFEIYSNILENSDYFKYELINYDKYIKMEDIDPNTFRYILILLRTGELYYNDHAIIEMLNQFHIDYEIIIDEEIKMCNKTHDNDSISHIFMNYINQTNTNKYSNNIENFHDIIKKNPYIENYNTISTNSAIKFNSTINFDLSKTCDCIKDIILCIDLPILKNKLKYVDNIHYKILENIRIVLSDKSKKEEILLETNGNIIQMISKINNIKPVLTLNKLIYQDHLLDIYRLEIPLFLLSNKDNFLPISKFDKKNITTLLQVNLSSDDIILDENYIEDIPLLNASLTIKCVYFIPNSLNYQLLNSQVLKFYYDNFNYLCLVSDKKTNLHYNTISVDLDKYECIRDCYIIITKQNSDTILENKMIDIEIFYHNQLLYSNANAYMMNEYIPLTVLGKKMDSGVYYYNFVPNPKSKLDGFFTKKCKLNIRVKNDQFVVNVYIRQCLINKF